jgi:hypothetical protein
VFAGIRQWTIISATWTYFTDANPISLRSILFYHFRTVIWCSSSALHLYSGRGRFEYRSGHRLSWLRFWWFSSVPQGIYQEGTSFRPWPDRFLLNPFQFNIRQLSYHSTPHHHHHHWAIAFLRFRRFCLIASYSHSFGFRNNTFFTEQGFRPCVQSPTWRTRPLYLCPPVTGWSSYTPRHRVLFSSPSTSCRATVEVRKVGQKL